MSIAAQARLGAASGEMLIALSIRSSPGHGDKVLLTSQLDEIKCRVFHAMVSRARQPHGLMGDGHFALRFARHRHSSSILRLKVGQQADDACVMTKRRHHLDELGPEGEIATRDVIQFLDAK